MAITVMLSVDVKKDKIDQFSNLLKPYLLQTREYKGFQDIQIYKDIETNTLILYSIWDEKKDYESYLNRRIETGVMGKLGELLEKEPNIKFYENLNL